MEPIYFSRSEYIVTIPASNIISTQLNLYGGENVLVGGLCLLDHDAIVRGDLSEIEIGMRTVIGKRTVLRPSSKPIKGGLVFFPMKIGENVFIGDDCIIKGMTIGSNVRIGNNCVISHQCVLSSCCEILPDTILAPGTVVPPFGVFGGQPGRLVATLPEGFVEAQSMFVKAYYDRFQSISDNDDLITDDYDPTETNEAET